MRKPFLLLLLMLNTIFQTGVVCADEVQWKKVVRRSLPNIPFVKTTKKLPKDQQEELNKQLEQAIECPISYEEFDDLPVNTIIAKTPCNHFFCYQSLSDWIERTKVNSKKNVELDKEPIPVTCPYCKQLIPNEKSDLVLFKKKKIKSFIEYCIRWITPGLLSN